MKARYTFTEAERKQQQKVQINTCDSTIQKVAVFLIELLALKISSKRKKQNIQLLLVAVQHWYLWTLFQSTALAHLEVHT